MTRYEPKDLAAVVERKVDSIGTTAFVTRRSSKRLREMWCAAKFGAGYARNIERCLVEIADVDEEREFDFHLCVGNEHLPFQITEVLDKSRRRGDEYRQLTPEQVNDHNNNLPWQGGEYAGRRIREELQAKFAKYGSGSKSLHMLLYVNVKVSSLAWASVASAAESEAKLFSSVWLTTHDLSLS